MKTRVLRPVITISAVTAVLVAALAFYAFMTTGATHASGADFNPAYTTLYCNGLGTFAADPIGDLNGLGAGCVHSAENLMQGAAADYTTNLDIPAPNANFSSVITFAPPGTGITAGCNVTPVTSCGGGTSPAGTKVGGLHSVEDLGIGNGPCNTNVSVDFVLYSVALPNMVGGSARTSTNLAWPRQTSLQTGTIGDAHRFNGWTVGPTGTLTPLGGGTSPHIDLNGGSPVNALGDATAIQNYPAYLLDVFSPTPGGIPILPRAVYGGLTLVAGADWIPLYFVQFAATDIPALNALGGGLHISTSAEGAPSVSVLVDPSSPASPSSITDFCTGSSVPGGTGCITCGGSLHVTTMLQGIRPSTPSTTISAISVGLSATISGTTGPSADAIVTTTAAHQFNEGDSVTITGSDAPEINGTHIIKLLGSPTTFSFVPPIGTAAAGTTGTAFDAQASTVTTTALHGLSTGDTVTVAGTNSTPSLDGTRQVGQVFDTTHFQILGGFTATVAGTAGTVTRPSVTRATNPATGAACSGTPAVPSTDPGCNAYGQPCATQCTKFITVYASSLRDLDQDGIENELDTCPTIPNISGDPRDAASQSGAGADNGIDGACSAGLPALSDADSVVSGGPDGFKNRQDNCPAINNPTQKESEVTVIQADNGPEADGMGDACDTSATTVTGICQNNTPTGSPLPAAAPCISITLGTTVANGRYVEKTVIIAKCFGATSAGGTDADADGYCGGAASEDNLAGAAGSDADPAQHKAWNQLTRATISGDTDKDGVSDGLETYLGTDSTHSCAQTGFQSLVGGSVGSKAQDEGPVDNWAYDFNDDGRANTSDILAFASAANGVPFGKVVSAPAGPSGVPMIRFDLNSNGKVDTADILQYAAAANGVPFNKVCGSGANVITSITVAADAVFTTAAAHGFSPGDVVTIGGTNSTPPANGTFTIGTVGPANKFTVGLTTTVAGTAGCVSKLRQVGVMDACGTPFAPPIPGFIQQ
jgi:hypothetical protein